MKRTRRSAILLATLLWVCVLPAVGQQAPEASAALQGTWEGPWYRGMTSGRVKLQLGPDTGTIQFTNLDNFGTASHPIAHAAYEGRSLSFRADGEKGGPLTATLKLNEAGTQMKGLGKFDGFPLRFELKRMSEQ